MFYRLLNELFVKIEYLHIPFDDVLIKQKQTPFVMEQSTICSHTDNLIPFLNKRLLLICGKQNTFFQSSIRLTCIVATMARALTANEKNGM